MIIFCEECGTRNDVGDVEKIEWDAEDRPRCARCDTILLFPEELHGKQSGKTVPQPPPPRPDVHLLELRFHDHIIEISQIRPTVTMGRQRHNDLVVQDNRVSRSHARFEYRDSKFILIDQSTNGTYIFITGMRGMNLKQDELPIYGNGIIGLGRKVTSDSPQAIHFTII